MKVWSLLVLIVPTILMGVALDKSILWYENEYSIGPVTFQEQSNLLYRRVKIKGTDADFGESSLFGSKETSKCKNDETDGCCKYLRANQGLYFTSFGLAFLAFSLSACYLYFEKRRWLWMAVGSLWSSFALLLSVIIIVASEFPDYYCGDNSYESFTNDSFEYLTGMHILFAAVSLLGVFSVLGSVYLYQTKGNSITMSTVTTQVESLAF